jgi:hypothetical protein
VGEGREYVAAWAATTSWHALAALERAARGEDLEEALGELRDQGLAVAETVRELGDQAQRRALVQAVVAGVRMAAAVAAP